MSAEPVSIVPPDTEHTSSVEAKTEPQVDSQPAAHVAEQAPAGEGIKSTSEVISNPKQAESSDAEKAFSAATGTPLSTLFKELTSITEEAGHGEMWGVELKDASHVPTTIVLEKFLRANGKDAIKAKTQLTDALRWRKKMQPMKLLDDTEFDTSKFGDLGYVTVYPEGDGHAKEIVTWNIYGAVKDNLATFGNVEE